MTNPVSPAPVPLPTHFSNILRWGLVAADAIAALWPELDLLLARDTTNTHRLTGVDLLLGQITHESAGNPWAIGAAGEIGLLQIMPSTGRDMGYDVPVDATNRDIARRLQMMEAAGTPIRPEELPSIWRPATNVKAALGYLRRCNVIVVHQGFAGSGLGRYRLALSAYNGGPGNFIQTAAKLRGTGWVTDEDALLKAVEQDAKERDKLPMSGACVAYQRIVLEFAVEMSKIRLGQQGQKQA